VCDAPCRTLRIAGNFGVATSVEIREISGYAKFCAKIAMYARAVYWLCFAAVYTAHVAAAQEHRFTDECVLDLLWPRPDAVVLVATDSNSIEIFFKLQGNCTEFLRPSNSLPRLQLSMRHVDSGGQAEQHVYASPFSASKPCFAAIFSSPLIFALVNSKGDSRGIRNDRLWDVTGKHNNEASIWTLVLIYHDAMINSGGIHSPDEMLSEFEFYLKFASAEGFKKPSRSTLQFARLGHPSSHFHLASHRYNTLPGYACLSACGKICANPSSSAVSPVCSPISHVPNSTLSGPGFKLLPASENKRSAAHPTNTDLSACADTNSCPGEVSFVSIGGNSSREIGVVGPGRHRLLSVIAEVMQQPVGFILLKKHDGFIDHSHVTNMINKFDLTSSYAFIAFHHRRPIAAPDALPGTPVSLPHAEFGSIEDGILLSRAAAAVILSAANDEDSLRQKETIPAECSEFLIFSDAWLCWCAASLGIPSLNIQFSTNAAKSITASDECIATSPLYGKLVQLYEQQRLMESSSLSPPFTEKTTLGFQYFMQTLALHRVAGPHILRIPDDEKQGSAFFWDECCYRLLIDHSMTTPDSRVANAGLHPVLQQSRSALAAAPNRSAFVNVLRDAIISDNLNGRDSANATMNAVRRRLSNSVSAARVLGCSVLPNDRVLISDGMDLLHGSLGSSASGAETLQLHIITPVAMPFKFPNPVSRRLYLATHEDWSVVFGYSPIFSKSASHAFAAPDFGAHDWRVFCMMAVSLIQGADFHTFDSFSREYFACDAFASALLLRTYAAGMLRCFDLPPQDFDMLQFAGSEHVHARYFMECRGAGDVTQTVDDDPWMLRELAQEVQVLLFERWKTQQVRLAQLETFFEVTFICFSRAGSRQRCTLIAM
jgi:hypothetical protein